MRIRFNGLDGDSFRAKWYSKSSLSVHANILACNDKICLCEFADHSYKTLLKQKRIFGLQQNIHISDSVKFSRFHEPEINWLNVSILRVSETKWACNMDFVSDTCSTMQIGGDKYERGEGLILDNDIMKSDL